MKHSDKTPRIYASYFVVDKTETLSRAILNCKTLNLSVSRPPSLSLPSLEDIFALVSFFPLSSAVCCTADFRHYFYQIPLPSIFRHLFSVQCKSVLAELKAFAMGFSWSPFVTVRRDEGKRSDVVRRYANSARMRAYRACMREESEKMIGGKKEEEKELVPVYCDREIFLVVKKRGFQNKWCIFFFCAFTPERMIKRSAE